MKRLITVLSTAFLLPILVLPCVAVNGADAVSLIGSLTDPENSGIDGFVDILSASVEQDVGYLTFNIETRGNIPTTLSRSEDSITYLWFVDADNNPSTGQAHGNLGSDFNVRAVISERYGGGFVDVTGSVSGGGPGNVIVQANHIEITIGLSQIASPDQFHWRCGTFQMVNGVHIPGNPETELTIATTLLEVPPLPKPHTTITTPLLMLCPSGPASRMLTVEIRDAQGNLLDSEDYSLTFSSSNHAVATVDESGNVTAHAVPVNFSDTPYVNVWANGVRADNAAVIRVTSTDLGVTHRSYNGNHVKFYLPASIEGVDLNRITTDYQVVQATDLAYIAQQCITGTVPYQGGTQYFVLDVTDDAGTVPCGLSGNPIRLGWTFGKPIHNSCYIINVPENRIPQWGVMFHEMGHNFNGASLPLNQFCSVPSSPHNVAYNEGLATLSGMWSWKLIKQSGTSLSQLARADINANYANAENSFRQSLANYRSAGANYATLDANILDGVLLEMYDAYSMDSWFDLFSTFLPADQPLPFTLDTKEKQATWFVAAMSASAGQDLRSTFTQRYGFPIDNNAWPTILTCVQARINARTFVVPGDTNGDGSVSALDITKVERIIAGLDITTPGADANNDSNINALDITKVERLIAELD